MGHNIHYISNNVKRLPTFSFVHDITFFNFFLFWFWSGVGSGVLDDEMRIGGIRGKGGFLMGFNDICSDTLAWS
jgi:hypothetical protein